MQIWRALDQVPADLGRTVVVIGNFDGVHLGHRTVLARAREVATERGIATVVAVTFDPHPMAVLRPDHAPSMLTDVDSRSALLGDAGADEVLALPFDTAMSAWTPKEFVDRVLVETLHASAVVVGANFRFGARAAGDVAFLTAAGVDAGEGAGFETVGIPLDGGPQVWSSTYVRTCLAAGDVDGAAEALGRAYSLRGTVVRGDQRGREMGYPTANVPTHDLAVPADGVYAGWLRRLDRAEGAPGAEQMPAAISVGTNPTFEGERERRVESYVLDRTDLELYDVPVEVTFVARIRGMVRYEGMAPLIEQMADDVRRTREVLE